MLPGNSISGIRRVYAWLLLGLATLLLAAPAASAAHSTSTDPRLDAVASRIAERPITALCFAHDETLDPLSLLGAWGFTWPHDHDHLYLAAEICEGALAIADHDWTVPLWEQALGALVLTHESFHQRLDLSNRLNEAATECRAIRHFGVAVQLLGGSPALVEQLRPYALSEHYELAAQYPIYYLRSCVVPWWWSP